MYKLEVDPDLIFSLVNKGKTIRILLDKKNVTGKMDGLNIPLRGTKHQP